MNTIKSLGGRVAYDAPLMHLDDVVEKYKTVAMGALSSMLHPASAPFPAHSYPRVSTQVRDGKIFGNIR